MNKPPLLSDDQIDAVGYAWMAEYKEELRAYLYDQREIDIKYFLDAHHREDGRC